MYYTRALTENKSLEQAFVDKHFFRDLFAL
jgi:hypothetical protein